MKIFILTLSLSILSYLKAECSDLDSTECVQWSQYCEWDEDTDQCTEIGGGGGNLDYGPFDFSYLTESDGIRNGPDYMNGLLYYPTGINSPLKSIIFRRMKEFKKRFL